MDCGSSGLAAGPEWVLEVSAWLGSPSPCLLGLSTLPQGGPPLTPTHLCEDILQQVVQAGLLGWAGCQQAGNEVAALGDRWVGSG